jgi:hypothetical protein
LQAKQIPTGRGFVIVGAVYEGVNELEVGDIPLLSKEGKGVVIEDAKQPYG